MSKRIVYALPMPRGNEAGVPSAPADGQPCRFEKELIREGAWVHPTKKFTFRVTPKRMRAWVEAFGRMKEAGLSVPLPFGHSYDPRDNAGFLEALRLDGNRLVGVLAIPRPEDAERIGTTVRDVSVSVNPNFVDSKGNRFGEVIEHVALTNYPVVEGQPNFAPVERIAAGEDGENAEVWTFCAEDVKDPRTDGPQRHGDTEDETNGTTETQGERTPAAEPMHDDATCLAASREARGSENEETSNIQHSTSNVQQAETGVSSTPEATDASTPSSTSAESADSVSSGSGDSETRALRVELAREREGRIAAEVASHVSAGRIPPSAAEAVTVLLACEGATRLDLDTQGNGGSSPDGKGSDPLSVAGTVRTLLSLLPAGTSVDLEDRTRRLRPMPDPGNSGLATGRATAAAARRMLESRGYTVTLSDDGTTVLEAEKQVIGHRS